MVKDASVRHPNMCMKGDIRKEEDFDGNGEASVKSGDDYEEDLGRLDVCGAEDWISAAHSSDSGLGEPVGVKVQISEKK